MWVRERGDSSAEGDPGSLHKDGKGISEDKNRVPAGRGPEFDLPREHLNWHHCSGVCAQIPFTSLWIKCMDLGAEFGTSCIKD